jgi:hypothetical protein
MATTDSNTLIQTANTVVSTSLAKANDTGIGASVRDGLINSANSIQSILNDILKNNGLITAEQTSALDEQVRLAKINLLKGQSQASARNLALYVGIGVVIIGVLWYLTSKEKN